MDRALLFLLVVLGVECVEPLTDSENISGKLFFYQMDGNATYVRDTGELASDIPTETMFELSDPQQNFSMAKFSYTWDLGNGEVIQGTEPVVRYHYALSGNYTLRLKIGVNMTQSTPPLTGIYSKDVQVLDAIKSIELKGPSDYEVSQTTGLAFHVDGSPPMWVCWRFLPKCEPDTTGGCTLTTLYENSLWLNHTFTSAGVHCLNISVRNDISKLQTSFSLFVRKNNTANMLFILSCATILVATFSFITVIACHPRYHNRSQITVSSNALFLNRHTDGHSRIVLNVSHVEREEKEPLWGQNATHYYA
ncbi:transmembrane protein 130 isoform X1 [Phyllopteryx taeniolatus]|uniref:transmembrane protein 130 isoform X1 n=1 Tax=Phyllopteryx taeniolatus TaxID=161469 RepID=UPI002AD3AC4C|nr:transmembrane protein 130 isoform X1 [Phyllopteryx taeniolatus]XP_061611523.1 transmembrane protein 130 isoform X1 [Phyllopteryx taeniolatus]